MNQVSGAEELLNTAKDSFHSKPSSLSLSISRPSTFIILRWNYPLSHQLSEGCIIIGGTLHFREW